MTVEEQELLKRYLTDLNVLGEGGTHPRLRGLVSGGPLRPGPVGPTQLDGGLGATLQGRPRSRRVFNRLVATKSDQPIS